MEFEYSLGNVVSCKMAMFCQMMIFNIVIQCVSGFDRDGSFLLDLFLGLAVFFVIICNFFLHIFWGTFLHLEKIGLNHP